MYKHGAFLPFLQSDLMQSVEISCTFPEGSTLDPWISSRLDSRFYEVNLTSSDGKHLRMKKQPRVEMSLQQKLVNVLALGRNMKHPGKY